MPNLTQADKAFIVWDAVREIVNGQYSEHQDLVDAIRNSFKSREIQIGDNQEWDELYFRVRTCVGLIAGFYQPGDHSSASPSLREVPASDEEDRPRSLR